jgi:hypothetical protein
LSALVVIKSSQPDAGTRLTVFASNPFFRSDSPDPGRSNPEFHIAKLVHLQRGVDP